MQYAALALALATAVAAQGCSPDYSSNFAISVVKPQGTKREVDLAKRDACGSGDKSLTISLKGGVLMDQNARTGYIASNYQFQFDKPPQAGHLETSGFQVCANNSLALNGNAVFYQCNSGQFYNLYNKNIGAQCSPVEIMAVPCSGSAAANPSIDGSPGGSTAVSSATAAATPAPTPATAPSASQISDGQPQASSAAPAIATGAAAQYGPQMLLAAAGFAGAAFL